MSNVNKKNKRLFFLVFQITQKYQALPPVVFNTKGRTSFTQWVFSVSGIIEGAHIAGLCLWLLLSLDRQRWPLILTGGLILCFLLWFSVILHGFSLENFPPTVQGRAVQVT